MNSFQESVARACESAGLLPQTALTIGVFDGVHLGHQALVRETVSQAKSLGLSSVVLTFDNHPLSVLAPPYAPRKLIGKERKIQLLKNAGADLAVSAPFTRELSSMPPDQFVEELLSRICRVRVVVCGYDFSFGKGGEGNPLLLRRLGQESGFNVQVIEPVARQEIRIKSTHIRDLLFNGRVDEAARFLTRPHELSGIVVSGHGRGRTIGIPTANLEIPADYVVPARGVYFCFARIPSFGTDIHPAMVNIGIKPTFGDESQTVEAHLLEFDQTITGEKVELFFLERLRDEQKFPGVEALIQQLDRDRAQSQELNRSESISAWKSAIPPIL